VCTTRFWNNLQ